MAARTSKKKMDAKLDFLSSKFNPLKALYSEDLQPPVPNIYIFNNLAEYAQAIRDGKVKSSECVKPTKGKASSRQTSTRTRNLKPEYKPPEKEDVQERLKVIAESNATSTDKTTSGRMDDSKLQKFILAEEAFKAEQRKKKRMNVIERMEACSEGPFSVLHTCLTKRLRVTVWTRRYKGLRSVLAGYLVAFDKHMNLALFDVDEVYTLEERIEQPEVSDKIQGMGKKNKKKTRKKNAKFPIANEAPSETLNDNTIDQNSSTIASVNEVVKSSARVSGCEDKITSMEIERSGNNESPDAQSSIPSKETATVCKDPLFIVSHATSDHAVSELSMDVPEEESLMPSAKVLSVVLQCSAFSFADIDGHSPLAKNETGALSKCSPKEHGGNVTAKASTETMLERSGSDSGVTELESTHLVCAADSNNGDISGCNIPSVAANVEIIDEKESTQTQRCDFFAESKQQPIDKDREMSFINEENDEKRDFDLRDPAFSPSKISVPDFVISTDAEERELSASEVSTRTVGTKNEEKASHDASNVEHFTKMTRQSTNDNCNDITVDDNILMNEDNNILKEEQNEMQNDREQNDHFRNDNNYPLIHSLESEKDENIEQESKEVEATLQASSLLDSKPDMLKCDESVEKKIVFGEKEKNENGWLGNIRVKSESTKNVESAQSVNQAQNGSSDKTNVECESKGGSWYSHLEHRTTGNERRIMEQMIPHAGTVSHLALNDTEQVKIECTENVGIGRDSHLEHRTTGNERRIMEQMIPHAGTVSHLALNDTEQVKIECTENVGIGRDSHLEHRTTGNERTIMEEMIPRTGSECTENVHVEITQSVNKAQNGGSETHLQRDSRQGSWNLHLEHRTTRNEISMEQIIDVHTGAASRLLLNAEDPIKGNDENVDLASSCETTQSTETALSMQAMDQAMEYETAELAETEPLHYSGANEGLAGEEKRFQLHGMIQENTHIENRRLSENCLKFGPSPGHSCGDTNKMIYFSSYSNLGMDSSGVPLVCAKEDEETNYSSVCLVGKSESQVQRISNRVSNCVDITRDALEDSYVGTPLVPLTAEENKLTDFVAPEPANSVPIVSVNSSVSRLRENEAVSLDTHCSVLTSNSEEVFSQGEEVSAKDSRERQYICGDECVQLKHNVIIFVNEPSGNLTDDHQLGTSKTVQNETKFSEVEVTNAYSDLKKNEAYGKPDELFTSHEKTCGDITSTCEDRTEGFDTLGDQGDTATSLDYNTESAIGNLVNLPEKENDLKNELGIDSSKKDVNSNSKQPTLQSELISDMPSNKGTEDDCGWVKTEEQTEGEKDNPLRNTIGVTEERVGEDDREEGEISSEEDDTSDTREPKREEKEISVVQKPNNEGKEISVDEKKEISVVQKPNNEEKEISLVQKPKKEDKEEGELTSSDSDAEVLVETSHAKQGGASLTRSKVIEDKNVLKRKEKELLPARRHSSSEGHRTLSRERSRLPESSSSKRRSSSSAIQNTDLRAKLSEARKKRTSVKSKTVGVSETKSDRVRSGSRPVDKAVKKNGSAEKRFDKPGERKVPCEENDVPSTNKGGHETKLKNSKLQQTAHVKRREAPKHLRASGSPKEDKRTGNQATREKLRHTPNSSKKVTGKPNGSSQGDKNVKKKSPRRQKIEGLPGKTHRDVKKTDKQPSAFRESDGMRLPKIAPHLKTTEKGDELKHNMDTAAAEKKDEQSKAKKVSNETQVASRPKAKTRTCSESNTKNSLSGGRKTVLKNKTTRTLLRGNKTAKPATESSVKKSLKSDSEKVTGKKAKVVTHPLTSGNKTAKGIKQGSSALVSPRSKAQSKSEQLCKMKDGKKSIGAGTVGKDDDIDKNKAQRAKTEMKVSPRVATRKVLKKSPANIASKAKTKPRHENETRPGNPRKRSRSAGSTDTRQSKKLRLEEGNHSSSKLPFAASTTEILKSSTRNSNRENQPSCSKMKVLGNKMVPFGGEKLKGTDEDKCVGDSKKNSDKIDDSIQAKPVLIGRNKCLVFKRRHVNQLFVRGDNVVMVAYAK